MIQVMKFFVHKLTEHREEAETQMWLAHKYYNELIALEIERRKAYREIRRRHYPELAALEDTERELVEKLEWIEGQVKAMRQEASVTPDGIKPTKQVSDAAQAAAIKGVKLQLKTVRADMSESRKAFKASLAQADTEFKLRAGKCAPRVKERKNKEVLAEMLNEPWADVWKELKAMDASSLAKLKDARAKSGIPHGTYAATEDAVKQASVTATTDPEFKRWDGGRKIGVQLAGDVKVSDLFSGKSGMLRLGELVRARPGSLKNAARHMKTEFRLRIGSDADKKPIWLHGSVLLHRPLPPDARVRWVYLVPNFDGFRRKYSLQFTLETERPLIERAVGKGTAVVELKWTKKWLDDGTYTMIAAIVNGTPLELPQKIIGGLTWSRSLRSAADMVFDDCRAVFSEWLRGYNVVPDWVVEETKRIDSWSSHGKLRKIAKRLAEENLGLVDMKSLWNAWKAKQDAARAKTGNAKDGDYYAMFEHLSPWLASMGHGNLFTQIVIYLDFWRRKDEHLLRWSNSASAKARGHRKDFYRTMAARMSTTFERCEISAIELDRVARRKDVTDDMDEIHQAARQQRVMVCPHEFVDALKGVFHGDRFVKIKREQSGDAPTLAPARKTKKTDKTGNNSVASIAAE